MEGLLGRLPGGNDVMHEIRKDEWTFFQSEKEGQFEGRAQGSLNSFCFLVFSPSGQCAVLDATKRAIQCRKHSSCALTY